jgi:hypothetical protein
MHIHVVSSLILPYVASDSSSQREWKAHKENENPGMLKYERDSVSPPGLLAGLVYI